MKKKTRVDRTGFGLGLGRLRSSVPRTHEPVVETEDIDPRILLWRRFTRRELGWRNTAAEVNVTFQVILAKFPPKRKR